MIKTAQSYKNGLTARFFRIFYLFKMHENTRL